MKVLEFTTNWNSKLLCPIFSTLRRSSSYMSERVVEVHLKGRKLYEAELMRATLNRSLADVSRDVLMLDTGYLPLEAENIVRTMHGVRDTSIWVLIYRRVPGTETDAYRQLAIAAVPQKQLFQPEVLTSN